MDSQVALEHRARVEEFQRKHRIGLLTLLFTDLVGSTKLKQDMGDRGAVALIQAHHALVRDTLKRFKEAEEISTAGDSFFIVFAKPSEAVQFSLMLQSRLRAMACESQRPIADRIGLHIGEVVIEERPDLPKPKDLYGLQVDIAARVMSLAEGDQILMTRSAFDNARQVLKGQEIEGLNRLYGLQWLNHGPYLLKGVEEPLEICEVGEVGQAVLKPPPDSEKVHRYASPDAEPVLGWRPAIDQVIPGTQWVLENKLGEGGFGEVWLGRHQALKERRVFKFCFRADRVRPLKREITLFRLLKERVGEHPNFVKVHDVYLDQPPYYLVMEYVEGGDLRAWCEARGGADKIPLEIRLAVVAQIAGALQAAHRAGVIHRDVKPSNILIADRRVRNAELENPQSAIRNPKSSDSQPSTPSSQLTAKLTDFGIGQVVSEEYLTGLTRAGFTQTMRSPSSSAPMGTQLYLAPELLAGQAASPRSDIYSLGIVLYQFLIGDFTRPLTTDWTKRIADPPLREDLDKCFAGDPQERFADAGQLAHNLRSLDQRRAELVAREKEATRRRIVRRTAVTFVMVAAVLFLAMYAFKQGRGGGKQASSDQPGHIKSLAVLPFEYVAGDTNKSYVANAMTHEIIATLGQFSGLKKVIGYGTMMTYQGTKTEIPKIAEKLEVDAIVRASVAQTSNQVRLEVWLSEAAQAKPFWNKPFLRDFANVPQLQNDVALAIAQAIHLSVAPEVESRLYKNRTVKPEALDYYWRGRILLNTGNNADNLAAITNFQSAVRFDPNFAEGWAALAIAWAQRSFAFAPEEHQRWESDSYEAMQRARDLDEHLAEAYVASGWLLFAPSKNFAAEAAVIELRHAIRLNPNSAEAHRYLGNVFSHTGFPDRAEVEHRRRADLEPEVPARLAVIGVDRMLKGEPQQALDLFQKDPGGGIFAVVQGSYYAWALFACGQTDAADDKLKDLLKKYPDDKVGALAGMKAVLLAVGGDVAGATNQIQNAMKKQETGYGEFHHTAYFIACAYARLNKQSEALDWLKKTADTGLPCYPLFVRDTNLTNLHANPNFIAFLKKQEKEWQIRSNLWFKADAAGK